MVKSRRGERRPTLMSLDDVRFSWMVLAVGVAAAAVFFVTPARSYWELAAWLVPYLLATGVLVARVRLGPGEVRGPLALLLSAVVFYFGASLVWYPAPVWLGYALPFPSPLDAVYFLAYTMYAGFLIIMLRRTASHSRLEGRLALVDAGLLTTALSAVLWAVVIQPSLDDGLSTLSMSVAVLYPAFQLLLFVLAARLAIGTRMLAGAGLSIPLFLWLAGELFGDVFYGFQSANGTFDYGGPLIPVWLLSFTGLAAFAAHPGVVVLLQGRHPRLPGAGLRRPGSRSTLGWVWHAVLLAAAAVPLVISAVTTGNDSVLTALGVVMFALVLYRISLVSGDLAEQRRLSVELERAVARLRGQRDELRLLAAAVDTTTDSVVTTARGGVIVGWNTGAEHMYGYSRDEALGRHIEMLYPNQELPGGSIVELLEQHGHLSLERQALRKDGSTVEEETVVSNVSDSSGQVLAVVHIGRDVSERNRLQREVAVRAERLDEAQRIAGVGSWHWDVRTGQVAWSRELRRIFRLPDDADISLQVFLDHLYRDDRERVEQLIGHATARAGSLEYEARIVRGDGELRWVAVRGQVGPRGDDGEVLQMTGTLWDITERKRLENNLHYITTAVSNASDGIVITDEDQRIIYVNAARVRMHGYQDAAELLGQHFRVLFDEAERPRLESVVAPALRSRGQWHGEATGRRRDGSTFAMEISRSVMPDGHLVSIAHDITERREAEQALRVSEERYRLVTHATQEVLWDVDYRSGTVTWRGAVGAMFGYADDDPEVDRDWLRSLVHAEDLDGLQAGIYGAFASGEDIWGGEFRFRRQDGQYTPVLGRGYVVRDEAGVPVRFVGSMMDISERKRYEAELLVARQQAEEASKAKSLFLANMSHEIRTPMAGVLGMAELLLDTELDTEQRQFAETVHRSGDRLLRIINDILDFSKIEAGKMPVDVRDFDVREAVREAAALVTRSAAEKGLDVITAVDDDVPQILAGDAARLGQVLGNLLSNAAKFTEHGSVRLSVEAVDRSAGAGHVRFTVADSGIGLTREEQGRLFQSFTQADASTTRRYGGSGLGLAICKQLVELMGGTIRVESETGRGSTFSFVLPLSRASRSDVPATAGPQAAPRRDTGEGLPTLPILVVDDNEVNQQVASAMLANLGYAVDMADDGREAVERAGRRRYAAILMDVQMPVMDGYEATAAIRAGEDRRRAQEQGRAVRTPVIAMTANAFPEDRQDALRAGMDDYIAKPVRVADLEEVLARWATPRLRATGDRPTAGEPKRTTVTPSAETLDSSVLAQLRQVEAAGAQGFLDRVVSAFVEDAGRYVAELKDAVDMADEDEARSLAHRLKGSSGSVGAQRVSDICALVEQAPDPEERRILLGMLEAELTSATVALESELRGRESLPTSPAPIRHHDRGR